MIGEHCKCVRVGNGEQVDSGVHACEVTAVVGCGVFLRLPQALRITVDFKINAVLLHLFLGTLRRL